MATLDDVREAMKARKSYISANLETLTAKQTRKLLAKDLGVESSELDHFKSDIKQMLEEVLQEFVDHEAEAGGDAADTNVSKASSSKKKRKREAEAANDPKASKGKSSGAAAKAQPSGSKDDAKVAKLKRICQQAGIAIGPSLYKREDRAAAFQELLDKHGLSATSSTDDIKVAKAEIERQKELEGIDVRNIVDGGRRPRRAAAAAAEQATASAMAADTKAGKAAAQRHAKRKGSGSDEDDGDEDDDFGNQEASSEGESSVAASDKSDAASGGTGDDDDEGSAGADSD